MSIYAVTTLISQRGKTDEYCLVYETLLTDRVVLGKLSDKILRGSDALLKSVGDVFSISHIHTYSSGTPLANNVG